MHFQSRTVHQPGDGRPLCAAPTLIELKDDTLLAAWYGQNSGSYGELSIKAAIFDPIESRWKTSAILNHPGLLSSGNPVLFRLGNDTIWLVYNALLGEDWSTCQVRCVFSKDEGKSWSEPNILCAEWGSMVGIKPLVRPDGSVLLPLHKVGRTGGSVNLLKSSNGGYDWSESSLNISDTRFLQTGLASKQDGSIIMYLRSKGMEYSSLLQVVSKDEGHSWTCPERTPFPNPHSRVDLERLSNGNLLIAYNHSLAPKSPLTIALTENDEWTSPIQTPIELVEGAFSNPTLLQTRDQLIHLIYSSRLSKIVHVCLDEEWLRANALERNRLQRDSDLFMPVLSPAKPSKVMDRYPAAMWRPKLVLLQ